MEYIMDWTQGFTSSFYGCYVDPSSWLDAERFEIISGSIDRTNESLRESASVALTSYEQGTEKWIRIYLDTRQDSNGAHIPLFTGLAVTPDRDIDGMRTSYTLDCYSVLKPAQDVLLQRGWYAPVETSAGAIINRLLSGFAPVIIEPDSPTLTQAIVAEDGETNLSMTDKILAAINWRLRIEGDGRIHVEPKPLEPSAVFDALSSDVIEPAVKYTHDWFNCPNCFRAVSDDLIGIAKDDSVSSPLSTVNRGREVWAEEDGCELSSDESIAQYAYRRLKELQSVGVTVSYSRRFDPNVYVGDKVVLHYPAQGLEGTFTVTSQSVELEYGARVSEEVENEPDD